MALMNRFARLLRADVHAVLDRLDRRCEARDLAVERVDRVAVMIGGLLVGAELRERVRHGEQRLLHR